MEKTPHNLTPIGRDDPGIPLGWFYELDQKCTKWLRDRGLYHDSADWRDLMYQRMNAERKVRQASKMDDFIDGLGRD